MLSHCRWLFLSCLILVSAQPSTAQEAPPIETRVKTLIVDPNSQTPVVVLESLEDKKLLPIWIDVPEARAIALELEHVATPRPLTHDLIRNILQGLGATLQRVTITDIRNNTYFAVLTLRHKGQETQIDSRPSDAIAVALRMKAPIYASPQVFAKSKQPPAEVQFERLWKRLGFYGQELTAELASLLDVAVQKGVLVADVIGNGAAKAGMERGDIVTKANDRPVQSIKDLDAIVRSIKPPERLRLEVIKKGKPSLMTLDLTS
ncbi:MAG TPA: bifunctional nuclease domain-containing protein [Candidatus Eisenbacteria bacterium]|nr:bifunctional nuclease domain-containing protein [Candidatus Eisenbacteria bacterium]